MFDESDATFYIDPNSEIDRSNENEIRERMAETQRRLEAKNAEYGGGLIVGLGVGDGRALIFTTPTSPREIETDQGLMPVEELLVITSERPMLIQAQSGPNVPTTAKILEIIRRGSKNPFQIGWGYTVRRMDWQDVTDQPVSLYVPRGELVHPVESSANKVPVMVISEQGASVHGSFFDGIKLVPADPSRAEEIAKLNKEVVEKQIAEGQANKASSQAEDAIATSKALNELFS